MSRKGVLDKTLDDFSDGKIDALLGTQMVAKGLNFPGVRLVGVILADTTLNLPDFRAAERTFALVTQVAGRAGRFQKGGRVLVQTYRPTSTVLGRAAAHDAAGFYADELAIRRELDFPPYARLLRIVIRSKDAALATGSAAELAGRIAATAIAWRRCTRTGRMPHCHRRGQRPQADHPEVRGPGAGPLCTGRRAGGLEAPHIGLHRDRPRPGQPAVNGTVTVVP